ncbi:MAG: DUF4339 domain-containing protein, partial [Gammaproteobacteria bacterium]|nr:DUF4339 domain-containing protein [Gammaproteobacteria bacterium]
MTNPSHWYLQRGDKVTGPFPTKVISDHLILGRIQDDDLISNNRSDWQPVSEHRELYPEVLRTKPVDGDKLRQERLKLDERLQQRRAESRSKMADERRRARDRRSGEDSELIEYRNRRAQVFESLNRDEGITGRRRLPFYLAGVVVVLITT